MKMKHLILSILFLSFSHSLYSAPNKGTFKVEHDLAQRLVIFPLKVEKDQQELAENIWWDLRAKLTDTKRFLIASKNFMQSKNVFQPRSELKAADAILLGRLLDAHGLITISLDGFSLTLRVYDGRNGNLLSFKKIELHPSVPASKQLAEASEKLLMDFVASFPYQSYVVVDNLVGRPVFKEGDVNYIYTYLGENHQASVGDKVQVIKLFNKSLEPLFSSGGQIDVIAEGVINSISGDTAKVVLNRTEQTTEINEFSLVRLPSEEKRLKDTYALLKSEGPSLELDALGQSERMTDEEKEKKPLVTAVSFIANLVIMFLVL